MRTIGVVTVGRSDYGLYLPVLRRMQEEDELRVQLIVSGSHLVEELGLTVDVIRADGLTIADHVEALLASDSPEGLAKSMGLGTIGFAQSYARLRPDVLFVLGDRFEMHAAVVAALPFKIPVAHISGGEITEGAVDDALRHSMTKLSHLHFVTTEEYARRVLQMGEEPWRVVVSGSPSLDNLRTFRCLDDQQLQELLGLRWNVAPLLVTYHPVTLEYEQTEWQVEQLLGALEVFDRAVIFTLPNVDTKSRTIIRAIRKFVDRHPAARLVENLGTQQYFSMMACAAAMVGNSSSGIVEAPSFGLPVVNIGARQQGRLRVENVVDVGYSREEIVRGITQALAPGSRDRLRNLQNPYGDGRAAERIVSKLMSVWNRPDLLWKKFVSDHEHIMSGVRLG